MERERQARVTEATQPLLEPDEVRLNVALWVRMFRAGFQRQLAAPQGRSNWGADWPDEADLLDLLRVADERRAGRRETARSNSRPARTRTRGPGEPGR